MENFLKVKSISNLFSNPFMVILLLLSVSFGCSKDETSTPPPTTPASEIAYITNEGGFGANNGSISKIDISNMSVSQDYFQEVNGFKLGDIVQSMGETTDKYFIVVNNSAKIEVVDKTNFSSQMVIDGLESPRYFLPIDDTLAYVSDLFAGAVHQINYLNGTKYNDIEIPGWSEQMERINDEVFVTLFSSSEIGIIDIETHLKTGGISVDLSPLKMVKDKFDKLWVLGSVFGGASKLYKINTESKSIEKEWLFTDADPINQLTIDPDGNNIYYAVGDSSIFKMDVTETNLPLNPIISHSFQTLYGLNVNSDGLVFACQAYDFTINGDVLVFADSGFNEVFELINTIPSGVNPNGVIFTE